MRNRAVAVLLMPILALVFMIGWVMACSGEKKGTRKTAFQKKLTLVQNADSKNGKPLEMGLLEELTEKDIISK